MRILAVLLVSLGLAVVPSAASADSTGTPPECVAVTLNTTVLHNQPTVTVCRP